MQGEVGGDGCMSSPNVHGYGQFIAQVRFIIDGVITLPIALYGFAVFPDVPATTKAFYLTDEVMHQYCLKNHANVHSGASTFCPTVRI